MADTRTPDALGPVPLGDVLERITDGIIALDADWRIVYINTRGRELLDARDRPLIGEDYLEAFPRAAETSFVDEYRAAFCEQRPRQFVEHSRTVDRSFEVQVFPSPNGISVYFRDVTERVRAELERTEREGRQDALIQFGRIALGRISTGRLLADALELLMAYIAVPYAEIFLYDARERRYVYGEVAGLGIGIAPRSAPPLTEEALAGLLSGTTMTSLDVREDQRFLDGDTFDRLGTTAALCVPVGTEEGALALMFAYGDAATIGSEANARFAEAIATTLTEALRSKNTRRSNREILESINDAFVACDENLTITYVNERMAAFWQMRAEEIVGKNLEWFSRYSGGAETIAHYKMALLTGKSATFEAFFPERQRWYENRVYPFASGVAGYVRDVTRRKGAEMQIRELNVELERRVRERTHQLELANADLESFAYSVSHDLRAPLRAIDGFSQALEEDYGHHFDREGSRLLGRVRNAATRMAALIDALLDLARIARKPMTYVAVDVSKIAQSVVDDLRRSSPSRDVRVLVESGMGAFGEPALVRACLENLIGNAWKFTRDTPGAEIHVGRAAPGEFFVRDNGAGFDMAYANKLFGAFQRLHSVEEFEGTGVGLASVAKIVHRHGGEIRAEGSVGRGATFTFTLPTEAPSKE